MSISLHVGYSVKGSYPVNRPLRATANTQRVCHALSCLLSYQVVVVEGSKGQQSACEGCDELHVPLDAPFALQHLDLTLWHV
jgi:hypothetical protein